MQILAPLHHTATAYNGIIPFFISLSELEALILPLCCCSKCSMSPHHFCSCHHVLMVCFVLGSSNSSGEWYTCVACYLYIPSWYYKKQTGCSRNVNIVRWKTGIGKNSNTQYKYVTTVAFIPSQWLSPLQCYGIPALGGAGRWHRHPQPCPHCWWWHSCHLHFLQPGNVTRCQQQIIQHYTFISIIISYLPKYWKKSRDNSQTFTMYWCPPCHMMSSVFL